MTRRLMVLAAAIAMWASASASVYFWKGGNKEWLNWGDLSSWRVGGIDGTDATELPDASDSIYYPQTNLWANLGGQSWEIGTYDQDVSPRYGSMTFVLTNGTLTIKTRYESYTGLNNALWNGATLIIGPSVTTVREAYNNAASVNWTLHPGSRMEVMPRLVEYFQCYYDVKPGATLRIEAADYKLPEGRKSWPNEYRNHGTTIITNGLVISGTDKTSGESTHKVYRGGFPGWLAIDQYEGTLQLGGEFNFGKVSGTGFFVVFYGGMVDVVKDTRFVGFDCAVSNNAQVTVNVAAGAKMDMSSFTYGTGSSVTKTGDGTLVLGATHPPTLTVSSGAIAITSPGLDLSSGITFSSGTRIVFAADDYRLDSAPTGIGFENVSFEVDTGTLFSGAAFFVSSDATLRATVRDSVVASLPTGYSVRESGDSLVLLESNGYIFDSSASSDLADASAWGGALPPAGADVRLQGAGTVNIGTDTTKFKSITLELGARLRTTGGTEADPVDLPPITAIYDTALIIGANSYANLTNGFDSTAVAAHLPIFEVETNGIVFVQDPTYPARGIYFKNVDFRLYGQLRVPWSTSSGNYLGSQIFIGHAEPGETSYIAFTADGGSIYAPSSGAPYSGNRSLVSIASPDTGGRVKVVRDVVFRYYRKINKLMDPDNPCSANANSGYAFGRNNPVDEVFNVIVDGCLLAPGGPTYFAGGSRTRFINGGDCRRPEEYGENISYGHTRGAYLMDAATITFEGGRLMLDPCCGTSDLGKGFTFNAAVTDSTILTLAGGAQMTFWNMYGNGKGVCEVTDGTFNVARFHPPRMSLDTATHKWSVISTWTPTNTPAFNGFASVNIPANGILRFNATDEFVWRSCNENDANYPNPVKPVWFTDYWEWNRKTALEVPVTGAGDVLVTNTLSGADFRNVNGLVPGVEYPDLSAWSMNLIVRGGANTCTGRISAEDSVRAYVYFADGANWAGTVVANGHAKLGDPILEEDQGHAATPAVVSFHALELGGNFPLRIWKGEGGITNDIVNLETAVIGGGRFVMDVVEGAVATGDRVNLGLYPASGAIPRVKGWAVIATPVEGSDTLVRLTATRGNGSLLILR